MLELPMPTLLETPDNNLYVGPLRSAISGAVFVPPSAQQPATASAKSGNGNGFSAPFVIESPSDAYSELLTLVGFHTSTVPSDVQNRLLVLITDISRGERKLMNYPIPVNHIFGTPQNPFYLHEWAEPLMLQPEQILMFQLINPSTAGSASYSIMAGGRKFQKKCMTNPKMTEEIKALLQRRKKVYPFFLTFDNFGIAGSNVPVVTLAAPSSPANVLFNAKRDQTLILTTIMGNSVVASGGDTGDTQENFAVDLFDDKTEQQLNNQPITFNNLAGTAQFPFVLPSPIVLEPLTAIRAQITTLLNTTSQDIMLTFGGICIDEGIEF